jgi:hypothetical protein
MEMEDFTATPQLHLLIFDFLGGEVGSAGG